MRAADAPDTVLRAKYHDWCSARLSDALLRLAPDELLELSQPPQRDSENGFPRSSPSATGSETFRLSVQRITRVLRERLDLPSFQEWLRAYRANPERYEADLLGLWKRAEREKPTHSSAGADPPIRHST